MRESQAATGQNVFWRKTIWWLLALFLVSVALRIPNLSRPLSKHHEFCTALTLIIVEAWADEGIAANDFNPSTTFSLPADKFINNCSMDTMQHNGNFYYLSHPPLAYYVPYAIFKISGIAPSPLALQPLNLFFEFITIVFVYLITSLILKNDHQKSISIPALIAAAIYLFLPVTLWFHSNAYMADMFVQNMWAPALFISLKIFMERKEKSVNWLIAFAVSIFLMTYTDWLGALFSATVFLSAAFYVIRRKEKSFIPLTIITAVVPVFTVLLVLFQYASINGWGTLIYCYTQRYAERGSLNWNHFSNLMSVLSQVGFNYLVSYAPVLPLLVVFIFRWKAVSDKFPDLKLFIWLTLVPVLLDHFLFLRYAVQDFGVLKASFLLSIIGAVALCTLASLRSRHLLGREKQSPEIAGDCFGLHPRNDGVVWGLLPAVVICIAGIAIYYYINRPGEVSFSGDRYDAEQKIGLFIREHAKQDEVVFLQGADVSPQIVYYAHRNIKEVRSEADAKNFLLLHPADRGIIIQVKKDTLTSIPLSE
ncbi:MAG: hypothetical protein JST18_12255 [Bacteroidetes bacterium]|nr:hypothetical protein [Bacteroidota bacterium]